jgi:hypothetical protein
VAALLRQNLRVLAASRFAARLVIHDRYRLRQIYRDLGLELESIHNPVESGILNVWQRMHAGRLKVFASLLKYREERRLYRRDTRDQIVKDHDNLQDALRCLVNGISNMRTEPKPPSVSTRRRSGSLSWMV